MPRPSFNGAATLHRIRFHPLVERQRKRWKGSAATVIDAFVDELHCGRHVLCLNIGERNRCVLKSGFDLHLDRQPSQNTLQAVTFKDKNGRLQQPKWTKHGEELPGHRKLVIKYGDNLIGVRSAPTSQIYGFAGGIFEGGVYLTQDSVVEFLGLENVVYRVRVRGSKGNGESTRKMVRIMGIRIANLARSRCASDELGEVFPANKPLGSRERVLNALAVETSSEAESPKLIRSGNFADISISGRSFSPTIFSSAEDTGSEAESPKTIKPGDFADISPAVSFSAENTCSEAGRSKTITSEGLADTSGRSFSPAISSSADDIGLEAESAKTVKCGDFADISGGSFSSAVSSSAEDTVLEEESSKTTGCGDFPNIFGKDGEENDQRGSEFDRADMLKFSGGLADGWISEEVLKTDWDDPELMEYLEFVINILSFTPGTLLSKLRTMGVAFTIEALSLWRSLNGLTGRTVAPSGPKSVFLPAMYTPVSLPLMGTQAL